MAKMLLSRNSQCLCTIPSGAEAASSFFYSKRIAELSERRSKCDSQVEFDVESSTSSWTAVSAASANSGDRDEEVPIDETVVCAASANSGDVDSDEEMPNDEAFEKLKEDPEWGPFFRRSPFELEIGDKIAEGGQGEIFEALGVNKYARSARKSNGSEAEKASVVVKVFKEGFPLGHLKRSWPPGLASAAFPQRYFRNARQKKEGGLCWALGAQLLDNGRFVYIFDRYWGDLRKRIDEHLLEKNGCPPFTRSATYMHILQIAQGMYELHKLGFLHNDLKAANVLEDFACDTLAIADFESSVGIKGTGFWRAPEVLLALKSRDFQQETFTQHTTQKTDVYSFAMTCYEVITGRMPFEGHNLNDYDIVLRGERPMLPGAPYSMYNELIGKCWHQDPRQRPSFGEIVEMLERIKPKTSQCRRPKYYLSGYELNLETTWDGW